MRKTKNSFHLTAYRIDSVAIMPLKTQVTVLVNRYCGLKQSWQIGF